MDAKKIKFTLFCSNSLQNPADTSYPHRIIVHTRDDLIQAVRHDFVNAEFSDGEDKNHRKIPAMRCKANFVHADSVTADLDNDHSDDPADWVTPQTVQERLPGVMFAATPSRNHFMEKKAKKLAPNGTLSSRHAIL